MENVLEDRILRSNFSTVEYARIESKFNSITDHINVLSGYIEEQIVPYINKGSFLDIGAGPGFITHKLLRQFDRVIALDPNECYAPYYANPGERDKLNFINKNFESVKLENKFDFILCSHVLYHIPQNQWVKFIQKILKLLKWKGNALLTLVATSGKFHDLCERINPNYSNSQRLKFVLGEMKIPYTTTKISSSYAHKEANELLNLLQMFVIDDCFLPEEYACLSDSQINKIDRYIVKFVEDSYNKEKQLYAFQIEEDYIQLRVG